MLVILGILAAVVVVNVVGLTGRGEAESYATDESTIQLVVSTFYADVHAYSSNGGWNEEAGTSVHNYPTASGAASMLYLGNETGMGKYKVNVVMNGNGTAARDADIQASAIWMGLLVNGPGDGTGISPVLDDTMDNSAPLAGEHGPYLNPLPRSCSKYNSLTGTGTITWVVGAYNRIYGVFEDGGRWYAGFGGRYP